MPNPGYPSPRTWADGVIPFPWLRQDVAGAAALLERPPIFIGSQQGAPQAISSPVIGTPVDLDTEWYDPYNMHRLQGSGIHLSRAYPYLPGWYLAQALTPMGAAPFGTTGAGIGSVQNGASYSVATGQTGLVNNTSWPSAPIAADLVQIAQTGYGTGDYAEASVFGAGNMETSGSLYPRFEMRWIGNLTGVQPLPAPPITPVPRPPGYIDEAWLNANIRDTIDFLIYPPFGKWTYTLGQNIASQPGLSLTGTRLFLNNETVSSYTAAMNLGASRYTAPVPGTYWTYVCMAAQGGSNPVAIAAGATVQSANYNAGTQLTLWGGGQAVNIAQAQLNSAVFRRHLRLNAGDTVIPAGFYRDSGGSNGTVNATMIIAWRSL